MVGNHVTLCAEAGFIVLGFGAESGLKKAVDQISHPTWQNTDSLKSGRVDNPGLDARHQARHAALAADPILQGVLLRVGQTVGITASIVGASLSVAEFRRTDNRPSTKLLLVTYPMG